MAVPKRKTSKSRRNMRNKSNSKIFIPAMSKCANCHVFQKPHFICSGCGFYKAKQVIKV